MFKNMKVRSKQFLLIIIFTITMVTVVGVNGNTIMKGSKDADALYYERLLPTVSFGKYRANNRAIESAIFQSMQNINREEATQLTQTINTLLADNEKFLQDFSNSPRIIDEEKTLITELINNYAPYKQTILSILNLGSQNKNKEAYALWKTQGISSTAAIVAPGEQLEKLELKLAEDTNNQNTSNAKTGLYTSIGVAVVLLIVSIIVALLITKAITSPLQLIQRLMVKAGKGDFTETSNYQAKDELGMLSETYNEMSLQVRNLLLKVGDTANQVAAFSEELNASAGETTRATEHISEIVQDVASNSQGQVDSIEDTMGTLNQLVDGVGTITKNASVVSTKSGETSKKSADGNVAIQTVVKQMNSINQAIGGLNIVIVELGERSNEIGEIVQVITGIAAQTNLLALNAAIEAARAGEQGKGFAVVAAEVRKLAEQSGESAQKISGLIGNIQAETEKAVQSMQFATNEVKEGIDMVSVAGKTFVDIQDAVTDVNNQIEEVSSSINKMFKDTETVVKSVNQIQQAAKSVSQNTESASAATQEQLASMEEIAAASTALSNMAEELQGQINEFKV